MKKKRFQKPASPNDEGAPQRPGETTEAKAASAAPESSSAPSKATFSVSGPAPAPTRLAALAAAITDEPPEPTAAKTGFPVLAFTLLAFLIYWGDMYLMDAAGNFSAKVYSPYVSTNQLDSFLPKDDTQIFRQHGQRIFNNVCAACHMTTGLGSPGQNPPLAGSDWVLTEGPSRIIRLVLHGGVPPFKVNGAQYSGAMPPQRDGLSDDDIAAVLTYVRSEWGNKASVVTPAQVKKIRDATKDRAGSWTMDELMAVPDKD